MSQPDPSVLERYSLYAAMSPPPHPRAPIHSFFAGIPAPAWPISHDPAQNVAPIIIAEDSWTESIVFTTKSPAQRRSRVALSSNLIKDSHFSLNYPLRRGRDRLSQTWLGCMLLPSKEMVTVVVKLFQESYFPAPDSPIGPGRVEGLPVKPDPTEAELLFSQGARYASAEANAYTRLADLQGVDIPWSYGFYKFRIMEETPEMAYGHVMEYIPVPTAQDALRAYSIMHQKPSIPPLRIMDALVEGLGKLHKREICHRDLGAANYIIVQNGDDVNIIFIDFGFSISTSTWGVYADGQALIGCLWDYDINNSDIKKRREERRGSYYDVLFENVYLYED